MDVEEDEINVGGLPTNYHWVYSMRREMQEIVPNVFLGPYQCAMQNQLTNLQNAGITHILCVRQDIEARTVKVNFPQNFSYKVIEMRDCNTENIILKFPEARLFINACLESGGKILVHGLNGMSRRQALHSVKNRRMCITLNSGFCHQLMEYEPIYRARNACKHWDDKDRIPSKRRASDDEMDIEKELYLNQKT